MRTFADYYHEADYIAICGSRLFGYAGPTSDYDKIGFIVPDLDVLFGYRQFHNISDTESDTTIYSLLAFINGIIKGDSKNFESLWSNQIVQISHVGGVICSIRELFVSQTLLRSMYGFALSEINKAQAIERKIVMPSQSDQEVWNLFVGRFQITKDKIKQITEILFDDGIFKESTTVERIGGTRKDSYLTHGYCVKNACNAIRLLHQAIELEETGKLTFPSSHIETYRQIRAGITTLPEVMLMYKELTDKVGGLLVSSKLPRKPQSEQIYKTYEEIASRKVMRCIDQYERN